MIADIFDPPRIERLDASNLQERHRELLAWTVLEQQETMDLRDAPSRRRRGIRQRGPEADAGVLDDPGDIRDQGDAAISHDRRAGEDIHALQGRVHRLDHDFFGPANVVHQQAESLPPCRTTTMYSATTGSRLEAAYFSRISALVRDVNGPG